MGVQSRKSIALLSIGQSQEKPDYDFTQHEDDIDFISLAPLDAYPLEKLLTLFAPKENEFPISSTTRSGERILVSKTALAPELQKGIRQAEDKGVSAVVVTCTGDFSFEPARIPVILPGEVLKQQVQAVSASIKKAAVLVPVDEQKELLTKRWRDRLPNKVEVHAFTLSPQAAEVECHQMGATLVNSGFDTAIMDCFGHSLSQCNIIKEAGLQVFNAKEVTIKQVTEGIV